MASPIINIKFLADLKQFSSQLQNANRSISSMGKSMQKAGANLTAGLTAPLVGLGALGLKTFADFEQEMAKVNAISGATAEEFSALEANAKTLGASTRFAASEVAGLQLSYSKLGFNPQEIIEVTEATLDLALATGEDLANSATVAASTLRGFGLDASETQRVTDVMAKSFSSSALDLEKFKTAMSVLAPVAKTAGVSLEEATGLLSTLVNAGVDASTAGTGLRNVFLDIADKGITMTDAMSQIQNSTNKNKTAMELFGKRGATVANILADNVTAAQEFTTAYQGAEGAAADMAAIMDNTLQGAMYRVKSAMEGAFISIGEQLAPVVLKLAEYVTSAIDKFNGLSDNTKKFIVILGGVAAAVGPLLALAGTILPAIGTGFALLTGPIGLIVAGLAAVGVIIYKNWAPIKRTLIDIANYFIDLYNESSVFRAGVEAIRFQFKNLMDIGVFVFDTLKSYVTNFVESFINGFKTFGAILKAALTGNFKEIPKIIGESLGKSKSQWNGFTDGLADNWKDLTDGIKQNGEDAFNAITKRRKIEIIVEGVDTTVLDEAIKELSTKGIDNVLVEISKLTNVTKLKKLLEDDNEVIRKAALKRLEVLKKITTIPPVSSGSSGVSSESDLEDMELADQAADLEDIDIMTRFDLAEADAESASFFGVIKNHYAAFVEDTSNFVDDVDAKLARLQEVASAVGDAVGSTFSDLAGGIVNSLGLADSGFQGFVKGLVGTITKLISMMLASSISQSIAGATASGTATGPAAVFTTPAFIATAVSGVLAAFAAIPKFATGGVVSGSSYYGDKILARINSGELILNTQQQKTLYNQLNTPAAIAEGAGPIVLDTVISGSDINLVARRDNKQQSRRGS